MERHPPGAGRPLNEVLVRAFRDADEPAVRELWQRVFADDSPRNAPPRVIEQKRHVQPELFLVAEIGGDVVGTTLAGDDGHRGWLHLVAVSPDHRGADVGRALVEEATRRLRERGVPKVNLQIRADNAGVVAFYQSLGFVVEERISMGRLLEEEP
ncbi:MAG: GNAT family acetyltransferase [Myxococcales bacterium]|nr:GNAT family acetyltransferase [Myxococcales bacterium]